MDKDSTTDSFLSSSKPRFLQDNESLVYQPELGQSPLRGAYGASLASEQHPERNEDSFIVDQTNDIYGVFDGVGGYAGGEIASRAAMRVVAQRAGNIIIPETDSIDAVADYLEGTLIEANYGILALTPDAASTAVVAKVHEVDGVSYASIAHIGDSRAYILHDGVLRTVTTDHTPYRKPGQTLEAMAQQEHLANVVNSDELSIDSLIAFRRRNIIGAYLGRDDNVLIDVKHFVVTPGDVLILTSDGVHDNLTTNDMQQLLSVAEPEAYARILTQAANERAQQPHLRAKMDDITAVTVTI